MEAKDYIIEARKLLKTVSPKRKMINDYKKQLIQQGYFKERSQC